jgi:hypothetical protein
MQSITDVRPLGKRISVKHGFAGNRAMPESPYITDGVALMLTGSVVRYRKTIQEKTHYDMVEKFFGSSVEDQNIDPIWTAVLGSLDRTTTVEFGEYLEPTSKTTPPLVRLTAKTKDIYVDRHKLALVLHVTGADEVRAQGGKDTYKPLVFLADGDPVAILMPRRYQG